MANTIDRLKSQLLTSGLQNKDQVLFQIINQLIDRTSDNIEAINGIISTSSGGGGTGNTEIKNTFISPFEGVDGEDSPIWLPGPKGDRGLQGVQGPPGLDADYCGDLELPFFPPGLQWTYGEWTPTIGGSGGQSGQTYSSLRNGYYWKLGPFVSLYFIAQLSVVGTITGNVEIQGNPFTTINVSNYRSSGAVNWANFTTAVSVVQSFFLANTNIIGILAAIGTSATSVASLVQADLAANTVMAGSITMVCNAP